MNSNLTSVIRLIRLAAEVCHLYTKASVTLESWLLTILSYLTQPSRVAIQRPLEIHTQTKQQSGQGQCTFIIVAKTML